MHARRPRRFGNFASKKVRYHTNTKQPLSTGRSTKLKAVRRKDTAKPKKDDSEKTVHSGKISGENEERFFLLLGIYKSIPIACERMNCHPSAAYQKIKKNNGDNPFAKRVKTTMAVNAAYEKEMQEFEKNAFDIIVRQLKMDLVDFKVEGRGKITDKAKAAEFIAKLEGRLEQEAVTSQPPPSLTINVKGQGNAAD